MPYIDESYYKNEYKGKLPSDPTDLEGAIERASEIIDAVTNYKLIYKDIESQEFNSFIREQIKKATASQAEYYIVNGGTVEVNTGQNEELASVKIGSFSYNQKSSESNGNKSAMIAPMVKVYLEPTGLLYSGLKVANNDAYY